MVPLFSFRMVVPLAFWKNIFHIDYISNKILFRLQVPFNDFYKAIVQLITLKVAVEGFAH